MKARLAKAAHSIISDLRRSTNRTDVHQAVWSGFDRGMLAGLALAHVGEEDHWEFLSFNNEARFLAHHYRKATSWPAD